MACGKEVSGYVEQEQICGMCKLCNITRLWVSFLFGGFGTLFQRRYFFRLHPKPQLTRGYVRIYGHENATFAMANRVNYDHGNNGNPVPLIPLWNATG